MLEVKNDSMLFDTFLGSMFLHDFQIKITVLKAFVRSEVFEKASLFLKLYNRQKSLFRKFGQFLFFKLSKPANSSGSQYFALDTSNFAEINFQFQDLL